MANTYFQFKQFTVNQDRCAMKVTTDGCLFGAWVASILEKQKLSSETKLLDIGTGTGLLSLMVAQKTAGTIDAVELNELAACQAGENTEAAGRKNINVIRADVLQLPEGQYDFIISNPPFYESSLRSPNDGRNAAHHGTGLLWEDLFKFIAARLKPDGIFFLLLPASREEELQRLVSGHGLYIHAMTTVLQTPAHQPFRLLVSGGSKPGACIRSQMTIRTETGAYSNEFTELLKDYYLHL